MVAVVINGYKSYIAKEFKKKYQKKYKIIHYKEDINNKNLLKNFISKNKFTHFIHFAGMSRSKCELNKNLCTKTNFEAPRNIIKNLNLLKEKPKFLFISSSHVYGNSQKKLNEKSKTVPKSHYAKLKLKTEKIVQRYYKNSAILRIFNVYGKNQPNGYFVPDMIKKIKNNEQIVIDRSERDFIHVKTVSKIINYILINKISGIINIGTGNAISLINIIKQIEKKIKKKANIKIINKSTKIISDISLLESFNFKFTKNEKNFNL